MAYRQILVHLDDDAARSRARIDFAVARVREGATAGRLVGAYVVDTTAMTPTLAAVLPDDVVADRLDQTGGAQQRAHRRFHDVAKAAGVEAEWRAPAGEPIEALVAHARCCDLVVLGQAEPGSDGARFAGDLVEAVLQQGGRPVLVLPFIDVPPVAGGRVLVAWDGSREGARAVADAMPMLVAAQRVHVLAIDEDPGDDAETVDAASTTRLAGWLAAHGVANVEIEHEATETAVGEWLLSRAADSGAGLLVMGAYSHAPLRERLFGGATRTLLDAMTLPVLFSH